MTMSMSRSEWKRTVSAPVSRRKREWFTILRHLARVGVTMSHVARLCNRNNTTVSAWANGSEPRESDARVVLALYAKYCPAQYQEHQREFEIRLAAEDAASQAAGQFTPESAGE